MSAEVWHRPGRRDCSTCAEKTRHYRKRGALVCLRCGGGR